MKVNMSFDDALNGIVNEIGDMKKNIELEENNALKKIGDVVKTNVLARMSRSNVEARAKKIAPKNYNGTRPYKHMKDDVKSEVKTSKTGKKYVIIHGGKLTGYKWKFLNDGTVVNGEVHTKATHFADNALKDSDGKIMQIIDSVTRRVAE